MGIIRTENLSFWYPGADKSALKNINLSINEGELILIVGPSGCGKSTLIRSFNRIIPDYYGGKLKGKVFLKDRDLREWNKEDIVRNIGMIFQHPERQMILQDVEREIAFGLENFNTDINKMKRNVAEVISLLSLNNLRDKTTNNISGGEKQKVAIASVVSMDPEIILFDEPISQLDPISGEEVLNTIKKLNRDMGKTILLVEQRLNKCFDMADRILFMEKGSIIAEGTPHSIPSIINKKYFLPNVSYIFKKANIEEIPVNVKEARKIIEHKSFCKMERKKEDFCENILEVKKINFQYKKAVETLKNINFSVKKGEVFTVMGANGAGKSTLFKIISGLIEKYKGEIKVKGINIKKMSTSDRTKMIGYLSQNPNDYFGRINVFEEIAYTLKNIDEYDETKVNNILKKMNLEHLKNRNPRDLSGGEKQRTAIACTLITNPDILILDEPTRGMDSQAKENLGNIIKNISAQGKSVVLITHDSDFAGDYSDRVMLMFHGEIIAIGDCEDILCDSLYYSPQIAKVFKNKCKVVSSQEAIKILKVI